MTNDECLINDEARMTNRKRRPAVTSPGEVVRLSNFVIRQSLGIRH
jgi:hypothetical protein